MIIRIPVASTAPPWAHEMARAIEAAVNRALNAQRPWPLAKYPGTGLPDATKYAGHLIYISTTNRVAYSDGTNWRYTSDEALV